jgi:hypothetical protein
VGDPNGTTSDQRVDPFALPLTRVEVARLWTVVRKIASG